MITIYKNQKEYEKEYEKAEMMDIWKADVVAVASKADLVVVANGDSYDIKKSRYTCRVSGVSYYYLIDLIRKTLINEH
jgi:hypothetical protein